MCDKAISENGGTLKFLLGFYKNQEIRNKAGDNYPHALEFVSERNKKWCSRYLYCITSLN